MAEIDLRQCDKACLNCVKSYKKKHGRKQKFVVPCSGIPKEYISENVLATLNEEDAAAAVAMMDPVTWAADVLDWHCLDPDGAVWKRKSLEGSLPQGTINYYDDTELGDKRIKDGRSPFHRPYQAEMLRCSALRKVFRIGRQAGKSEALIIAMLYNLWTHRNFKIVLVTPFQTQINLIFKRIKEHINKNTALSNSVLRLVQAPNYEVELHNGSFIRGFTAGTSSKGNATQARGQSANMLVFDEADYLAPGDIGAVLATVTNNPNATVWMSSTPSGKREKFYEACHNPLYKEFHLPSMVNPNWNEDMEAYFRSEYSETEYKHEVLAEFGEQEEGVFQAIYVQNAKHKYTYQDTRKNVHWQYCIGVDWNDYKVGTTIVVTGFNPDEQKFYVVDRQIVSREGWNQLEACQKIVEMNRKWVPEYIYIDAGHGGTQDEILRLIGGNALIQKGKGANHPDSRLANRLKKYEFGGTIEIRDPWTKQVVKKNSKPFLVENAVRKFETSTIAFPENDKQLETELLGYVVDRITPTGVPVYKQGNEKAGDHNLDALMLSLVAFELEMTSLGKPSYQTHVAFSGYFGDKITTPHKGQKIVQGDPRREALKKREEHKPSQDRTKNIDPEEKESITGDDNKLPAARTTKRENKVGLWSWKGFLRDEPPPQRKNRRRKPKPPKRKKF